MNQTGARDDARCWPGPGSTPRGTVRRVACTMRTSAGAFRAGGGGPTLWGLHGEPSSYRFGAAGARHKPFPHPRAPGVETDDPAGDNGN
jgi:hypothetical protein